MSDEQSNARPSFGESPVFVTIFRLLVPALLGSIITYAASINAAQRDQGKQLEDISGTLKVFTQINTDVASRLRKVEQHEEEDNRSLSTISGRVLVLEAERAKAQ